MALDAANQGLELEAEDVSLLNLRTQALIKLNRQADAQLTVDDALHRNPENSYSHANKGYSQLHSGDLDASLAQFKEALRLDPTNDFAKEGLKEAIKGKNIIYRGIQKYFLWMSRMQSQYQWGFIIGIYVLYRVILWAMDAFPALYPVLLPLAIFYVIFAFSTWIAQPISNLALRFHPLGKLALDEDEKLASNLVGLLGLLMIVALLMYFTGVPAPFDADYYMYVAGFLGLSMIPVSGMFSVQKETKARRWSMIYTLFLLACGLGFLVSGLEYQFLFLTFALGIFVYSFVVNYLVKLSSQSS
jgi:tetratricopeptide (TPR) repeat protein